MYEEAAIARKESFNTSPASQNIPVDEQRGSFSQQNPSVGFLY